jgi:hypothetical protein
MLWACGADAEKTSAKAVTTTSAIRAKSRVLMRTAIYSSSKYKDRKLAARFGSVSGASTMIDPYARRS